MQFPAARMGDLTVHGGTIVSGFPSVLIGGQPAARLLDMHTCAMFDGPKPHVGGTILFGSPTVLIGGMPAARVMDPVMCVSPAPDMIAQGCQTVLIGIMGTPFIAMGMPGVPASAGAAGSSAVAIKDAKTSVSKLDTSTIKPGADVGLRWGGSHIDPLISARAGTEGDKESTQKAAHWIEFEFLDSAGLPVAGVAYEFTDTENILSTGKLPTNGTLARDGIPAGEGKVKLFSLYNAAWSKEMAKVGETITMKADVIGFEAGTPATFFIYRRDVNGPHALIDQIETQTKGDTVEASWTLPDLNFEKEVLVPDEGEAEGEIEQQHYSSPDYYFEVFVAPCIARSGLLYYEDYIEIEVKDTEGNPLAEEEYILFTPNGEVRQAKLDGSGKAREEKFPAGACNLRFPNLSDVEYEE